MSDVQRRTRPLRICRALFTAVLFFDLAECALDLASGKHGIAILMAFAAVLVAATVAIQTFTIRRMRAQEIRELTHRAEQLELAAEAAREHPEWKPAIVGEWQRLEAGAGTMADFEAGMARLTATLGPCAHPDAEPVDLLLTGERVAWVCPDCNAELPAGWTPQAKGSGTLTAFGTLTASGGAFPATAALSGTGSLSAAVTCTCPPGAGTPVGVGTYADGSPVIRYCGSCGKRIREDEDTRDFASGGFIVASQGVPPARLVPDEAAGHFAALARVGLESCVSPCRMCEQRWLDEGRFE